MKESWRPQLLGAPHAGLQSSCPLDLAGPLVLLSALDMEGSAVFLQWERKNCGEEGAWRAAEQGKR